MERLQEQLVLLQYWIQSQGLKVAGDLRGPRLGRQGRRDQADHRAHQPAHGAGRRAAEADRARAHPVVLPAVRRAPAGRRRDGPVRPQLVQPLERRVGDGLLHRGGAPGVPAQLPGVRADAGAVGDHGAQVLVLGVASRSSAAASRRATPSRSSAGSSPTWTSPSTSSTCATRWRRTPRSSTPTSSRRPGTSSRPTTSGPRGSTASATCSAQFDYEDVAPDVGGAARDARDPLRAAADARADLRAAALLTPGSGEVTRR